MPQMIGTNRVVVGSFAEGSRIVRATPPRRESEDDILAHALYLSRHGRQEEAEEYLEERTSFRH